MMLAMRDLALKYQRFLATSLGVGLLLGVVESVASGEQLPFHTTEQLWRALYDLPSPRRNFLDSKPNEEGGT